MQLDDARSFIRDHSRALLATLRADGTPQMSPVLIGLDTEGNAVVSSRETAVKVHNLRRNPRAWACVLSEGFYGPWIQVEGNAQILSLPEAMEPLVAYYRAVVGEHPDWDDYRAAMRRDQRCVIRVVLTRAGPDHQG
ncbi:MAG: PPOX class F420-dependent oxidoreductase [Mycobacteriaceae bacterium]